MVPVLRTLALAWDMPTMTTDDLDCWRNRLAAAASNWILNHIATKTYADYIDGAIRTGIACAVDMLNRDTIPDWEWELLGGEPRPPHHERVRLPEQP